MDKFIYIDAQDVKAQIAALIDQFPELNEDEELRLDTFEGETDLFAIVTRALDARQEAIGMAEGVKARMNDLATRKARFEKKSDAMKRLIQSLMVAAGQDKLMLPEASLSITAGRESVNVLDVEALPQGYYKTERKADKTAIKSAILAGEEIPGAELVLGDEGLTIRTK